MTICECWTYICTCGKAMEKPKDEVDDYLAKYVLDGEGEEVVEEEEAIEEEGE